MLNLLEAVVNEGTGAGSGASMLFADPWPARPAPPRVFRRMVHGLVPGLWAEHGRAERTGVSVSTISHMGQGANMALPIWALFMQKVYADESLGISPEERFEAPEGVQH
jgi:penicillin-binding protein 1A